MKIVLATHNHGKIQEFSHLLEALPFEIVSQKQFSIEDIPETGSTFVENAILKARHATEKAKLPALADDSGLVVPALKGAPGIYSARYAGEEKNTQNNIKKLLANMSDFTGEQRSAYFYCVLVYLRYFDDPAPLICIGEWHGKILFAEKGLGGFGYDPIFFLPLLNQTAAELSLNKKNTISHRAVAFKQLLKFFREKF